MRSGEHSRSCFGRGGWLSYSIPVHDLSILQTRSVVDVGAALSKTAGADTAGGDFAGAAGAGETIARRDGTSALPDRGAHGF